MIICPTCAHPNREGLLFCEVCGDTLIQAALVAAETRRLTMPVSEAVARAPWNAAQLTGESTVALQVRDYSEAITLGSSARIVIGRIDPDSALQPDIDLTPFGGLDWGVSRLHAEIVRSEDALTIMDRGSANGTYLNGERLKPDQPRLLRDGDELRLGKLVTHIYFR